MLAYWFIQAKDIINSIMQMIMATMLDTEHENRLVYRTCSKVLHKPRIAQPITSKARILLRRMGCARTGLETLFKSLAQRQATII